MELCSLKLSKLLFFFKKNPLGFFQVFSLFTTDFYDWFLGVFIINCFGSCYQLSLPWLFFCCFFIRYFVFCIVAPRVLRIWGSFSHFQVFFILRSFCIFATVPRVLRIWESFLYSQAQPAFIKASFRAGSSSLKATGPPTEVRNTDSAHLYVWITQCSAKGRVSHIH